MADSSAKLEKVELNEVSDDDDEVALVTGTKVGDEDDSDSEIEDGNEEQTNGVMVLALLDKIIGVVDQIQQTQSSLEARQDKMEKSVTGIQGELAKLSKKHTVTTGTVNKMLDKLRKVNVNVKTVRTNLEKQAGEIKRLENNEHELLKRRNFKLLIYPEVPKAPPKALEEEAVKAAEGGKVEGELELREGGGEAQNGRSSEDEVEVEEIIEESRAQRIKRSGLQRMDDIKKAFSKEKMEKTRQKTRENLEKTKQRTRENLEKTRQRTRENLEKTRQRTRENLEKTKHRLETKMDNLSKRMKAERKERLKLREKAKKSRPKTTVYRVPPFTFHVKKIRPGQVEALDAEEPEEEEEEARAEEGRPDAEERLSEGGEELPPLLQVEEDSEVTQATAGRRRQSE